MNSTEMVERFRRFALADLSLTIPNRTHQVSEVLLETRAVRIILTRYDCRTESVNIDVEVSLPFLSETSDVVSMQDYVDSVIAALEYLKHLISMGFNLEIIHEEGVLTASAVLGVDTEEYVFKALEPPT